MGIIENKKVIIHKSNRMLHKKRRIIKVVRITGAIILLVGIILGIYYMSFRGRKEVRLSEYTVLSLRGYDGDGYAEAHLRDVSELQFFLDTVELKIDRSASLSNGDIVTISYTYDKKLASANKLKVRAGRRRIKVNGLAEATVITNERLFEGCKLKFIGHSPRIGVVLSNTNSDEVLSNVEYMFAEEYSSLKTGDTVVVEAIVDRAELARNAYVLESEDEHITNEYQVPVMDRYADNATLISDEDLRTLIDDGKAVFLRADRDASSFGLSVFSEAGIKYNLENKKYTFKWGSTSFISAYFNYCIDIDKLPDGQEFNDIRIVYDTSISQSDGQVVSVEAVVIYRNITVDSQGRLKLPLGEGEIVAVSTSDAKIKSFVRGLDEEVFDIYRFEYYY